MALLEEIDNMQEQMGKVTRDMETLRMNQEKMLEIKSIVTEMDVLMSSIDETNQWSWTYVNRNFQKLNAKSWMNKNNGMEYIRTVE